MPAVKLNAQGGYTAPDDNPHGHRSLTKEEVRDLQDYARNTRPSFKGPHNTPFANWHPVAQEIWENLGYGQNSPCPEDEAEVARLQAQIDALKGKA